MKARIRTMQDREHEQLEKEVLRLSKLWLFSLHNLYGFGQKRAKAICVEFQKTVDSVIEKPETWCKIDKLLIEKYHMGNAFSCENISERKQAVRENLKKWGS